MIIDRLQSGTVLISQASNAAELRDAVQAVVKTFGLDSYNLAFGKRDRRDFMTAPSLTSWNPDDLAAYNQANWADRDPLLDYAVSGQAPLGWGIGDWANAPCGDEYANYLEEVGVRGGITVPLSSGPENLAAFTALSYTQDGFSSQSIAAISLLARIALIKASTFGPDLKAVDPDTSSSKALLIGRLSARQIEVLEWASQGKSNYDIATILNQKKRTIDYHVSEILRKIGVATKAQAVAIFIGRE